MFKRPFVQLCTVILVGIALYGWLILIHAPVMTSTALAAQQAAILHEPDSGFPPVISYQGRLLDPATGQPKPDGGYLMLFALYKEASGGSPFWTESKNVTSNKGLFSTLLGDTTALTLADFNAADTLYLGVSVGGDPEATPRQRLASVSHAIFSFKSATALLADNANKLGGLDASAYAKPDSSGSNDSFIVRATQNGAGDGIIGSTAATTSGEAGVEGVSGTPALAAIDGGSGVLGTSKDAFGVIGISDNKAGVLGWSSSVQGVSGQSLSGTGVWAYSQSGYSVEAVGTGRIKANVIEYATPRTHYYSISGDQFKPRSLDSADSFSSAGATAGSYYTAGTNGQFLAPVHLPDGATITSFRVYFFDNSATQNLNMALLTHSLTGSYANPYPVELNSSGVSGNGSKASGVLNLVVDNRDTFYEVYVRPDTGNWATAGANLRIIGVVVGYTLSEAP